MYLDTQLLLTCVFYLHIGYHGEINKKSIKVDGRKLSEDQLNSILKKFIIKIKKYNKTISLPIMMSNEILVRKNISLHKYLKKNFN